MDGGVNLYLYVQSNPINAIDPWGLDPFSGIKQMMSISPTFRNEVKAFENISTEVVKKTTEGVVTYGPPVLAAAAVGVIVFEAAPVVAPYIMVTAGTPISQKIIKHAEDVVFGFLAATGAPKGLGYFTSGAKYVYERIRDNISQPKSAPCENK